MQVIQTVCLDTDVDAKLHMLLYERAYKEGLTN